MSCNGKGMVKEEPVDTEYDKAMETASAGVGAGYSDESSQDNENANRSEDSSQSLRGYLSNIIKDNSREISVKSIIEDLLEKNETLLAQNDALLYKPQARTQRLDIAIKCRNDNTKKPRGAAVKDDSYFQPCDQSDASKEMIMNMGLEEVPVWDGRAEEVFSTVQKEIACGISSPSWNVSNDSNTKQISPQMYWCNFCSFKSLVKHSLLQHVMSHRFHCKSCSYESFSRADVIRHSIKNHQDFLDNTLSLEFCFIATDFSEVIDQSRGRKEDDGTPLLQNEKKRSKKRTYQGTEDYLFDMEVYEESNESHDEKNNSDKKKLKVVVPKMRKKESPATIQSKLSETATSFSSNSNREVLASTSSSDDQTKKAGQVVANLSATGLCWNCGYCDFVTLSQTILKLHLNSKHSGKAHKYVAMLMSSMEEMSKIKEKDEAMFQTPNPTFVYGNVSQTPAMVALTNSKVETADESESMEDYLPEVERKKYPLTYKCAHCNFNAPVSCKVKEHLQNKHSGCVLYSLDMRAVKLKQRRYVFFCHRRNCSFTTKKTEEYLSHSESCTPWLDPDCPEKVDKSTLHSLESTRNFSIKIATKASQMVKNFKSQKSPEYACVHCTYTSNNNTRVKKHVLTNHVDNEKVMKDLNARQMKKKMYIYFCQHCFWETRNDIELMDHLKEKHDDMSIVTPVVMPEAPEDSEPMEDDMSYSVEIAAEDSEDSSGAVTPAVEVVPKKFKANTKDDDDDDDNFDDVELPDDIIRVLMDQYVTDEAAREGKSQGRPTRNAAAKAQIRFKAQGHSPQLFKCHHCSHMNFGVNLIRNHMTKKHPLESLRAIDLKRKMAHQQSSYAFCPQDGCKFNSLYELSVISHAKSEHDLDENDEQLQKLSKRKSSKYECIYCSFSFVSSTTEEMRRHVVEAHPNVDVMFRDAVAHRQKKTSKIYSCSNFDCSLFTCDQQQYILHKLAHSEETIITCSLCEWFSVDPSSFSDHIASMHPDQKPTTYLPTLKECHEEQPGVQGAAGPRSVPGNARVGGPGGRRPPEAHAF